MNTLTTIVVGLFILISAHPRQATAADNSVIFTEPVTAMEFILVHGGCYKMGDTVGDGYVDELVHEVCVEDFYIGKYEVTQGEYKRIAGKNPSYWKGGDKFPVEKVNWHEAQDFITKMNTKTSKNFRLPTEAEWEYAARSGGKIEKYAGSTSPDDVAWYRKNSDGKTHRVGEKLPNGLGIYDMSGNVKEWCEDWYDMNYYQISPKDNPKGPTSGERRIARGGHYDRIDEQVRTFYRDGNKPEHRRAKMGFRLVMPVTK